MLRLVCFLLEHAFTSIFGNKKSAVLFPLNRGAIKRRFKTLFYFIMDSKIHFHGVALSDIFFHIVIGGHILYSHLAHGKL